MNWKIPKYYQLLEQHLNDYISHGLISIGDQYDALYNQLKSPNTKRILFDSRQATIFCESGGIDVEGFKLQPPFDHFYMEFTEPIEIGSQEPGFENDRLVSILYMHNCSKLPVIMSDGKSESIDASAVTFIFCNFEKNQWIDRTFRLSVEHKIAIPAVKTVRETTNPSEVPNEWTNIKWFVNKMDIDGIPNRKIGWWENVIDTYTNVLFWIFAYTMSKSIKIVSEPISRQLKRFHERQNTIPRPWHHVWVEPKLVTSNNVTSGNGESPSYRYDVIGHLRFNKHKLKGGEYKHTVEWVPAHQRGLENDLYIPKIYNVKMGNKPISEMKDYFGNEVDFKNKH